MERSAPYLSIGVQLHSHQVEQLLLLVPHWPHGAMGGGILPSAASTAATAGGFLPSAASAAATVMATAASSLPQASFAVGVAVGAVSGALNAARHQL